MSFPVVFGGDVTALTPGATAGEGCFKAGEPRTPTAVLLQGGEEKSPDVLTLAHTVPPCLTRNVRFPDYCPTTRDPARHSSHSVRVSDLRGLTVDLSAEIDTLH